MTLVDSVQVVRFGGWGWAPGWEIFWMDPHAADEPLALLGIVIRSGPNVVLVNCGPDPADLPRLNAKWAGFDPRHQVTIRPEEQLDAALASAGVTRADITHVIATPFQGYALGNMLAFPNAQLCLSRVGWIDFHAPRWRPHPHDDRWFCIPEPVLVGLVTHAWDRVRLVHDEEIVPGVDTIWTGVHHRSTLAVRIQTRAGVAIASDAFMRVENITRRHPIGINESLEEALTAYDRIAREADILLPLYDDGVFARHPGGIVV
jgi:hypothetical protein